MNTLGTVAGCLLGVAVVALAGCAGGGNVDQRADGVDKNFRAPDAQGRTVFSPPPLPPPTAMRLASGAPGPAYWQQRVDYSIEASLDAARRVVSGTERVTYHNNSPHELGFLWLNLEQNLFKEDSDGALMTRYNARFGNRGPFKGGLTIGKVEVAGMDAKPAVYGTVARLDLPWALAPGASISFNVSWSFPVPAYGSDRLGIDEVKDGPIFEIAQWFPSVCVYDDVRGWNTLPYLGQGEFYSDFGDYDVAITAPADHLVAGSGELVNAQEVVTSQQYERLSAARGSTETVVVRGMDELGKGKGETGKKTWKFRAENVRTFAWASSAAFIWDACAATVGDRTVLCQSFYPREAKVWEPKAKGGGSSQDLKFSVEHYSKMWLEYPYAWAVNVNGIVGGMEYPGFAMCGGRENERGLWGVTTHEIGHTWFPMTLNSNERLFAWMDEGFNTFINYYATKERYPDSEPARGSPARWGKDRKKPTPQPMCTPADQVADGWLGVLEYDKTATGLVLLRETILGPERFDAAFREYCRRWAFKHPEPADFFRTMEDGAGMDLSWFWNGWFFGTGVLDQQVTAVLQADSGTKGPARITFAQRGGLVMPVTYRLTFEDGTTEDLRLPVEAFFTSDVFIAVVYVDGRKIKEVRVDPEDAMPDIERRNNVLRP